MHRLVLLMLVSPVLFVSHGKTGVPAAPIIDAITIHGSARDEPVTVLVRGRNDGGCLGATHVMLGIRDMNLRNMLSGQHCLSEVAAFSTNHGAVIRRNPWQDGSDQRTLSLPDRRPLTVVGWAVRTKTETATEIAKQKKRLEDWVKHAETLFNSNACGVKITFRIGDEQPVENVSNYAGGCATAAALSTQVGFDPKAVNLYDVGLSFLRGEWCGNQTGMLSFVSSIDTAAHEIGHALGLGDNEVDASSNLMRNIGSRRPYVTVGQCYAANTSQDSALNTLSPQERSLILNDCRNVPAACFNRTCVGCLDPHSLTDASSQTASSQTASTGAGLTPAEQAKGTQAGPAAPPFQLAVTEWLQCDHCGQEDLDAVLAGKASVVPALESPLKSPPSTQEVAEEARRAFRQMRVYEVGRPEWQAVGEQDEERFVALQVEAFRARYQLRALHALVQLNNSGVTVAHDALVRAMKYDLAPVAKSQLSEFMTSKTLKP